MSLGPPKAAAEHAPHCLRCPTDSAPQGRVSAARLRQELEASRLEVARLGLAIARKAGEWEGESRHAADRDASLAGMGSAGGCAVEALVAPARGGLLRALHATYLLLIRGSWRSWLGLLRRSRALAAAETVTRLTGAAALALGVLEPLLRRKSLSSLRRWAGIARLERMLELRSVAVELQRVGRGFVGRNRARLARRGRAATAIQRVARGRLGRARAGRRARFLRGVEAVATIERKYLEYRWRRSARKLREIRRRDRAATEIEAAWRGFAGGRRVARRLREERRLWESSIMVQRLWRGVRARLEADVLLQERDRKAAATAIQAAARGRR